jgi:uncharacterized protein (UPF0305 family)
MIAGGVTRCCIDPIFIRSTPLHPSRIPNPGTATFLRSWDKYSKSFQQSTPWT